MNRELAAYLRMEATVAAAFSFFITGMLVALIHHKADSVPFDAFSIALDLLITCPSTFIITAFFGRASLRRTKTAGILANPASCNRAASLAGRLFRRPALFGLLLGLGVAAPLLALLAPLCALFGIAALPFGLYTALKCVLGALLGGGAALAALCAGLRVSV